MIQKRIQIELLSDMCVSDGSIYNSAIDTDICHDTYGFPYIPAKRLKGCLREAALELQDWGAAEGELVEKLFGRPGRENDRGCLRIGDALVENQSAYIQEIQKCAGHVVYHPENVLRTFSYIRTQTAIDGETGTADEQSLRTMRVANKGLKFYADIVLDSGESEEKDRELCELFKNCLKVFRHIGIARTRGFGRIKATWQENPEEFGNAEKSEGDSAHAAACRENSEDESVSWKEGSTYLEYEIFLDNPVICKSVSGQEAGTMDYIEGAKILGLVRRFFLKKGAEGGVDEAAFFDAVGQGKIKFSNAYLSKDGKRLHEVPACIYSIKNSDEEYRNKLHLQTQLVAEKGGPGAERTSFSGFDERQQENDGYVRVPKCDAGKQLNSMKHCYVDMKLNGDSPKKYSVETEERYHHRRPTDKSIGRALGKKQAEHADQENDTGELYQISSICAGQRFRGYISCGDFADGDHDSKELSCQIIRQIYNGFTQEPSGYKAYIGYGRSSEYGACTVCVKACEDAEQKAATETKDFYVYLLAPTIIYNEKAMYSVNVQDLIDEIMSSVDQGSGSFSIKDWNIDKYISTTAVGGFNVTWGYRKPTIEAFDKGTVLHFTLSQKASIESVPIRTGTYWFGERTAEGYGEAVVHSLDGMNQNDENLYMGRIINEADVTVKEKENIIDFMAGTGLPLAHRVADSLCGDYLRFRAADGAVSYYEKCEQKKELRPVVSNMLLICEEQGAMNQEMHDKMHMLEKVKEVCEKRFDKASGRKQTKLTIAHEIFDRVERATESKDGAGENEDILQVFNIQNQLQNYRYDHDIAFAYLKEFLIQLKYVIRSREASREV